MLHIAHFKRWRSQVFTSWCEKIQNDFLFSKITVFLMYREIYVHVFAIIKYPTYSILASVLCKKNEVIYWLKFVLWGCGCGYINIDSNISVLCVWQFPLDQTIWQRPLTWYGSANRRGCGYATGCIWNGCACAVDSYFPQIDQFTFFQHIGPNMK